MKKKFDYSKLNKIFEENWSSLSESKKIKQFTKLGFFKTN